MTRHRRADRVVIVGNGPRAEVTRHAGCSCGAKSAEALSDAARDIWWRRHREEVQG